MRSVRTSLLLLLVMDLPDDVLKKVYYKHAIRVIPGIDASRFPR